ncbi:MAG: ribosome silencing factor [Pseudomonadales bacterium]|nr:ribosome silencing factor [Pseudomonadales bacterium]
MTDGRSVAEDASNVAQKLCDQVKQALEDMKGNDIVVLDVSEMTDITDFMLIVSGTSNRHVKALANAVLDKAKELGMKPIGIEGKEDLEWVLVDLGDVLVHVMHPDAREFYNLEGLWTNFGGEN